MKNTILKLVRNACDRALIEDRRATASYAAVVAGHNAWDEANPMDCVGDMSMNPYYNVKSALRRLESARRHLAHLEAAYEFAVETFVE